MTKLNSELEYTPRFWIDSDRVGAKNESKDVESRIIQSKFLIQQF